MARGCPIAKTLCVAVLLLSAAVKLTHASRTYRSGKPMDQVLAALLASPREVADADKKKRPKRQAKPPDG